MFMMHVPTSLAIAALALTCAAGTPAFAENDTDWMYGSGDGYANDGQNYRLGRKSRSRSRLGHRPPSHDDSSLEHPDDESTVKKAKKKKNPQTRNAEVIEGGPKPDITPKLPASVRFQSSYGQGTIVIDTSRRKLFYVLSAGTALQYPISVGRQGFQWTGTNTISRVQSWPSWHPPEEMRERKPDLPKKMTGGLYNPLGAKALYLGKTLYRIHGTNNKKSIGRAASSGCFRMLNAHVVHLAEIARIGTKVIVLNSLPSAVARTIGSRGEPG